MRILQISKMAINSSIARKFSKVTKGNRRVHFPTKLQLGAKKTCKIIGVHGEIQKVVSP